jgi:butyryl-CoA dehydrogenase
MNQLINNRDFKFHLFQVQAINRLTSRERYSEHNEETFNAVLDTAEKIALKYFLPHNHQSDQNEPKFVDGVVSMIPEVKVAFDAFREAGFIAASMDFEQGGMQLPFSIAMAASGYFTSANPSTTGYGFLTTGAANLINTFGSEQQKQQFLPSMLTGDFSGTMALTEPSAGSSLSDITTQAIPHCDGSYRIKGQKIYISGGDHDLTDNIVHMVLAKIQGAPEGTKGISLFIVPKYRLNQNNLPNVTNDVNLSGLFHKMGYRGTTSTILSFGEQDDCHGYLVGEPHKGLSYMFQMMNEARLSVGFGAAMIGYRGYLESLNYARERPQGRKPTEKDPTTPQINIIEHADVRRMLLAQKSFVEGGTSLCFYSANLVDDSLSGESEVKADAEILLDLLMPIVKACNSDYGLKANELAIQILGGSGYTNEYPVEQCYRDNRLNPIHEGTNGIQALDLLGRKVWLHNGKGVELLTSSIKNDIIASEGLPRCQSFAEALSESLAMCIQTTQVLAKNMQQVGPEETLANASCYLSMMGKLVYAWMWLRQATVAENQLTSENTPSDKAFYQGKLQAAQYYFQWELPKANHDSLLLNNNDDTCLSMQQDWF